MPEKPFVNKKYKLEKIPGKGGWTYAKVPEIKPGKHTHFGWVKVKGSIDGVELKKYHLMPLGDGNLFLPVKAAIRKKIKKQEGDWVHVILYPDNEPLKPPQEMLDCLGDEPKALEFFLSLSEGDQKEYIDWIYSVKKDATKVERLAEAVDRLGKKQRFRS
jgi:hypothetical protein